MVLLIHIVCNFYSPMSSSDSRFFFWRYQNLSSRNSAYGNLGRADFAIRGPLIFIMFKPSGR